MPKLIDEKILFQATIDVLLTNGYEGATTKQIATAAGVHEATLFRKYGSKLGLFKQVIDQQFSNTALNRLVYTGSLEADLLSILQAYTEVNSQQGQIMTMLIFEAVRNDTLAELLQTPMQNVQSMLGMIKTYQLRGALKEEPPLVTLSVLIGPIMLQRLFQKIDTEHFDLALDLQQYLDSFLQGRRGTG